MRARILLGALAALSVVGNMAGSAAAQELRIGFINTLNHPLGKEQVGGFKLGLSQVGWRKNGDKIAGVATRIFYCDDRQKPDVGIACAKKFIEQNKVHIVAGVLWSNVLMAIRRVVVGNKVILLSTNAGASPIAARLCSRYFITSSWQNDQNPEAMGQLLREENLTDIYLMSANYQAGKDVLAGIMRGYKDRSKIKGRLLYKLGARDFQTEITRIRAAKPKVLVAFAPGPMGIAFLKQWNASGLGKNVRLYLVYTVDFITLQAHRKGALGTFHTNHWHPDSKIPANVKFIKLFRARMKGSRRCSTAVDCKPSHFAAQSYDAALLIASGIKGSGGKVDDPLVLMRAMRKANYKSVRGPYTYNVNGMPIQNFYKREVILGPDGKPTIRTTGVVLTNHKDAYWQQCKKSEWIR